MKLLTWRELVNNVMLTLTGVCTVVSVIILFLILGYLVYFGGSSLDWNFFTKLPLPPGENGGTIEIVAMAALIGLPVGFLAGVYLSEFEDKVFAAAVRYVSDLLNGIPSIVVGLLAWALLVKPMKGFSALAGSIALSVLLIPVVTRQTEQFLREVPNSLREGALALGANKWKMIATVVVPAGSKGVLTGMILGVARISGESAPLLFTAFNNQFWGGGVTQPTASLPVMIYTHAVAPYDDWHRQAWAAGLVLITLVLLANIAARLVLAKGISVPRG